MKWLLVLLLALLAWQFLLRESAVELGPGVHAPEAPQQRRIAAIRIKHRQQRLLQVRAQQLITAIQNTTKQWLGLVQLPTHAHVLRALTGELPADFGAGALLTLE